MSHIETQLKLEKFETELVHKLETETKVGQKSQNRRPNSDRIEPKLGQS